MDICRIYIAMPGYLAPDGVDTEPVYLQINHMTTAMDLHIKEQHDIQQDRQVHTQSSSLKGFDEHNVLLAI